MYYKLSDYAKKFNCHYRTAYNRYKAGKIKGAFMDETGHILIPYIDVEQSIIKTCAIYARVSNNDRKKSLDEQLKRLEGFAISNGYKINYSVKEIGSGLNDNRKKLLNLLTKQDGWDYLIVENKDRLTRFGFNYLETLLNKQGKRIIVVNKNNDEKTDLIQDLVSIIYSFSARIYGLRRAKNKQKEILTVLGIKEENQILKILKQDDNV